MQKMRIQGVYGGCWEDIGGIWDDGTAWGRERRPEEHVGQRSWNW